MKTIITYGTFDLFHHGHVELLRRAKELAEGGQLIVGLSSDEFNSQKGKQSTHSFDKRKATLGAIRYVDKIIVESSWNQKEDDIRANNIDVFVMGDDWKGKFDYLEPYCKVVYLSRTPDISSTMIKQLQQTEPSAL